MWQQRKVDEPGLIDDLNSSITPNADGMRSLTEVRKLTSNPRIRDFYVQDLDSRGLVLAGTSALSEISMLRDRRQRTYAIDAAAWDSVADTLKTVGSFNSNDTCISIVEIWYCSPRELRERELQWLFALARSFTDAELRACERTCRAINDVFESFGYALDENEY